MITSLNIALVFSAGLASVLSPCVLPVIPIVVTGTNDEHKVRPLLVISGIALTFILMGVVSSLFGSFVGSNMRYVEKIAGVLIACFGLLLILNVNVFKHMSFLSRFAQNSRGRFGGFFLGFTLGIIWIPCVGPMLSGVLAMVATEGKVASGVFFLFIYSLGFSIPMLIAGYASQFFRSRFRRIGKFPYLVNALSGVVILTLGILIATKGIIAFNF